MIETSSSAPPSVADSHRETAKQRGLPANGLYVDELTHVLTANYIFTTQLVGNMTWQQTVKERRLRNKKVNIKPLLGLNMSIVFFNYHYDDLGKAIQHG